MTTATLVTGNRTMDNVVRPRRSLEELVDRLIAAMFREEPQTEQATETLSVARSVHESRRLRQAGDVGGALAALAGIDTTKAEPHQARWAFAECTDLVGGGSGTGTSWSTARARAGPPRWCPPETAGRWRSRRSWGCGGDPARSSRSAASGG